jgi:hypothetical protein
VAIDWNEKSTAHLMLILGSLLRYKDSAKTEREKRKTKKNIEEIQKVLRSR